MNLDIMAPEIRQYRPFLARFSRHSGEPLEDVTHEYLLARLEGADPKDARRVVRNWARRLGRKRNRTLPLLTP